MTNWHRLFPWLLLLTAILGVVLLICFDDFLAARVQAEVFKVIADFVVTAGVGGAAALIFQTLKSAQERREADRQVRCETLREVLDAYNEVKEVRRLLRAEAIRPAYHDPSAVVLPGPYADLLRRLNLAQLKLETQIRLIESNEESYHQPQILCSDLGMAERYLGGVVGEWENQLGTISVAPNGIPLVSLPLLGNFVDQASFRHGVAQPIGSAFKLLGAKVG